MRIAGDMDVQFVPTDEHEARKALLGYAMDTFYATLASAGQGKRVSIKLMFDAEVTP